MADHVVAEAADIPAGERILVEVEERPICVFNLGDEYVAYADFCIHQGGPCGEGTLSGARIATFDRETLETTMEWRKEGKILSCPWHGWEYDLTTGECLSNRKYRLPSYPVRVEDGTVLLEL